MTTAVCIRCGALKFGALVPCPECGFHPQESEDKAKSIVLTNHYLEEEEIQRISGLIKAGEPVI